MMMRRNYYLQFLILLLAIVFTAQHATADLVTFTTDQGEFDPGVANQGWWSGTDFNLDSNDNFFVGRFGAHDLRNFFTFDLSSLGALDVVTSATLRLQRFDSSVGNEATETLEFFDVTTAAATLNSNDALSAAIHADLGSGTSYGSFVVPGSGLATTLLTFSLNAAALADINAAKGGYFSIGGALTSQSGNDALFLTSHPHHAQSLILNVEEINPVVPEPGSILAMLSLVSFGAGAVVLRRRRAKQLAA